MTWFGQGGYGVRFEWGPAGAVALAEGVAGVVVVDVLSFTTSVGVAVERGIRVYPHAWDGHASAARRAAEVGAELAFGRRQATADHPWTLSPAALRRAPFTPALVLPSPNGSAIAAAARGRVVVAACLRNAGAVGRWLRAGGFGTADRPVLVVAVGERWPDGSLRPSLEDGLGAGAVLAALAGVGTADVGLSGVGLPDVELSDVVLSPEAAWARAGYLGFDDVASAVTGSASGRELVEGGFGEDVAIAVELDAAQVVPVLVDGAFEPAD